VLLHYPAKRETRKLHFFTGCVSALPELNQLLLDFFSLFDSRLIFTLLYDSLNLVVSAFSSGLLGGLVQEKGSRERCSSWTVLHAQCTSSLSSGFLVSQGNAEALDKWGGTTEHHLISYFISNACAKNVAIGLCIYVKIKLIASQRWDVFETQCRELLGTWDASQRDSRRSCAVGATCPIRLKQCRESGLWKNIWPCLPSTTVVFSSVKIREGPNNKTSIIGLNWHHGQYDNSFADARLGD